MSLPDLNTSRAARHSWGIHRTPSNIPWRVSANSSNYQSALQRRRLSKKRIYKVDQVGSMLRCIYMLLE